MQNISQVCGGPLIFKLYNMNESHLQIDAAKAVPTNTLLSRMRLFVVATADVVTV